MKNVMLYQPIILSLIYMPLVTCLFMTLFGYKIGQRLSKIFSSAIAGIMGVLSVCLCYFLLNEGKSPLSTTTLIWLKIENLVLNYSFFVDGLSLLMVFIVSLISGCIILYSSWYMGEDESLIKFQGTLFFFAFSMNFMVTSGNVILFFIGWECIGLASFLLISHWMNRNEAVNGGLKAIVYNKVGDAFFIYAICFIYLIFQSFEYLEMNMLTSGFFQIAIIKIMCIALMLAAFVKSAMFLFHGWLFNAMEGPTPVSALLHSATMVTAGIFLLLRVSYLFENNLICSTILIAAGVLTTTLAAVGAYFQTDSKRIVAYSTCSQLGIMMGSLGFSCCSATMYHLVTHAFFKAMLFFIAGITIHMIFNHQDIRVGSQAFLFLPSPETINGYLIASLALFGFPAFSGFFSKDFLIESIFNTGSFFSISAYLTICIASGFTAMYSIKAWVKLYFYNDGISYTKYNSAQYAYYSSKLLTVLAIFLTFSVVLGFFFFPFFEKGDFYNLYHGLIYSTDNLSNDALSFELFFLPTFVSLLGASISFILNRDRVISMSFQLYFKNYSSLFRRDYSLNEFLNYIFSRPILKFSYHFSYKLLDRGFLEIFGPSGIWKFVTGLNPKTAYLHDGSIFNYLRTFSRAYFVHLIIILIIVSGLFPFLDLAGASANQEYQLGLFDFYRMGFGNLPQNLYNSFKLSSNKCFNFFLFKKDSESHVNQNQKNLRELEEEELAEENALLDKIKEKLKWIFPQPQPIPLPLDNHNEQPPHKVPFNAFFNLCSTSPFEPLLWLSMFYYFPSTTILFFAIIKGLFLLNVMLTRIINKLSPFNKFILKRLYFICCLVIFVDFCLVPIYVFLSIHDLIDSLFGMILILWHFVFFPFAIRFPRKLEELFTRLGFYYYFNQLQIHLEYFAFSVLLLLFNVEAIFSLFEDVATLFIFCVDQDRMSASTTVYAEVDESSCIANLKLKPVSDPKYRDAPFFGDRETFFAGRSDFSSITGKNKNIDEISDTNTSSPSPVSDSDNNVASSSSDSSTVSDKNIPRIIPTISQLGEAMANEKLPSIAELENSWRNRPHSVFEYPIEKKEKGAIISNFLNSSDSPFVNQNDEVIKQKVLKFEKLVEYRSNYIENLISPDLKKPFNFFSILRPHDAEVLLLTQKTNRNSLLTNYNTLYYYYSAQQTIRNFSGIYYDLDLASQHIRDDVSRAKYRVDYNAINEVGITKGNYAKNKEFNDFFIPIADNAPYTKSAILRSDKVPTSPECIRFMHFVEHYYGYYIGLSKSETEDYTLSFDDPFEPKNNLDKDRKAFFFSMTQFGQGNYYQRNHDMAIPLALKNTPNLCLPPITPINNAEGQVQPVINSENISNVINEVPVIDEVPVINEVPPLSENVVPSTGIDKEEQSNLQPDTPQKNNENQSASVVLEDKNVQEQQLIFKFNGQKYRFCEDGSYEVQVQTNNNNVNYLWMKTKDPFELLKESNIDVTKEKNLSQESDDFNSQPQSSLIQNSESNLEPTLSSISDILPDSINKEEFVGLVEQFFKSNNVEDLSFLIDQLMDSHDVEEVPLILKDTPAPINNAEGQVQPVINSENVVPVINEVPVIDEVPPLSENVVPSTGIDKEEQSNFQLNTSQADLNLTENSNPVKESVENPIDEKPVAIVDQLVHTSSHDVEEVPLGLENASLLPIIPINNAEGQVQPVINSENVVPVINEVPVIDEVPPLSENVVPVINEVPVIDEVPPLSENVVPSTGIDRNLRPNTPEPDLNLTENSNSLKTVGSTRTGFALLGFIGSVVIILIIIL